MPKYSKEVLAKIPKGYYCYDERGKCPYWSIKRELPEQENGYCSLLKKSDWDLNEEQGEMKWTNPKGKVVMVTKPHEMVCSLLFDQCKECGLKHYTNKELDKLVKTNKF